MRQPNTDDRAFCPVMWHRAFKAAHWHKKKGENIMDADNIVIHYYASSPFIVKACVNIRKGKKIVLSAPLKDHEAVARFMKRNFPDTPCKIINHK